MKTTESKRKLYEIRNSHTYNELMRTIIDVVIGVTDTRPKNNYIIKCKPFYKKYKYNLYEYRT